MEKKCNDKALREEQLEEECLQLREQLGLMAGQIEQIELGLERKVKDKDALIKKLTKQVEALEREKRLRDDMEELMSETQVLQDKEE